MDLGSFLGYIIGGCIFLLVFIPLWIHLLGKENDQKQQIITELQKHTELLTAQNDLLAKILYENSDEEKAELTEKLKQVSEILKN